jgi:hypothetical protein
MARSGISSCGYSPDSNDVSTEAEESSMFNDP